jgi:hypothetical protein
MDWSSIDLDAEDDIGLRSKVGAAMKESIAMELVRCEKSGGAFILSLQFCRGTKLFLPDECHVGIRQQRAEETSFPWKVRRSSTRADHSSNLALSKIKLKGYLYAGVTPAAECARDVMRRFWMSGDSK